LDSEIIIPFLQRGRDHELGTYDSYRVSCGLKPLPKSFINKNLHRPREFTREMWRKFSTVYETPQDIEIFPGGMSESPVDGGGIVGPTFACMLAEQFNRLKYGDRYFFTHTNVDKKLRFCDTELAAIRRRTIRDVICDNTDVEGIPINPFLHDKEGEGDIVDCKKINRLEPDIGCHLGNKLLRDTGYASNSVTYKPHPKILNIKSLI
jgi:hypothetical protein